MRPERGRRNAPIRPPAFRPSAEAPAALAALIALAGCASTGGHLDDEQVTPVAAPADRLWLELEGVYRDLGLPIASTDPRGRTLRSGNVRLENGGLPRVGRGGLVTCPAPEGEPAPGSEAGATLTVTTTLRPADGATDVVSRVAAWRPTDAARTGRIDCRSTGVLEDRIAELLRRRS